MLWSLEFENVQLEEEFRERDSKFFRDSKIFRIKLFCPRKFPLKDVFLSLFCNQTFIMTDEWLFFLTTNKNVSYEV